MKSFTENSPSTRRPVPALPEQLPAALADYDTCYSVAAGNVPRTRSSIIAEELQSRHSSTASSITDETSYLGSGKIAFSQPTAFFARRFNQNLDRGFSVDSSSALFSLIEGNIISSMHPSSGPQNNYGPRVVCSEYSDRFCSVMVRENFVHRWGRNDGTGSSNGLVILDDGGTLSPSDLITFVDNTVVQDLMPGGKMVFLDRGPGLLSPHILFSGNRYVTPQAHTRLLFRNIPSSLTGSQWLAQKEQDATLLEQLPAFDACRTVASYQAIVIDGTDPALACAKMHDDSLYGIFMHEARRRSNRFLRDSRYTAAAVNAWIAEGYGVPWP